MAPSQQPTTGETVAVERFADHPKVVLSTLREWADDPHMHGEYPDVTIGVDTGGDIPPELLQQAREMGLVLFKEIHDDRGRQLDASPLYVFTDEERVE